MIQLRDYQQDAVNNIYQAWSENPRSNILYACPTGGGKTVIEGQILKDHQGVSCAIAHRQELVTQISIAIARTGCPHRIIGQPNVVKHAARMHMAELGTSFIDQNARCAVASVDTLTRGAKKKLTGWLEQVTLWMIDEGHHLLQENKWGNAVNLFPNARGVGLTATPGRADGKGLGRHADGVYDNLIMGPSQRWLIEQGFLCDYRIFCPPNDLDLSDVGVSKTTGEFNEKKVKEAVRRSKVIGNVVDHYVKHARGKTAVTFATDVDTATDISMQFKQAGIPTEVVSAKTPDTVRREILRKLRERELWNIVNVDLFGEGFDLPAIEVVIMARPTASLGLYMQQFGRGLRPMEGKEKAIIIDHVNNAIRHGLPDKYRDWSLDRRDKRRSGTNSTIPTRACPECTALYERIYKACPFCGCVPEPTSRSDVKFVDGDLFELDQATLAAMRGEELRIDGPPQVPPYLPQAAQKNIFNTHVARQKMQQNLRAAIDFWCGLQNEFNYSDNEMMRLFYFTFGIDLLSARMLGKREAAALTINIYTDIDKNYHKRPKYA